MVPGELPGERGVTLEANPESVRVARRYVVEAILASGHSRDTDTDTAELLVSELVTNAILHARSRVELTVRIEGERLRVGVGDASSVVPTPRAHDAGSQTGRGLELVALLSDRWGVVCGHPPHGRGQDSDKLVWFELGLGRHRSAGFASHSLGPDGEGTSGHQGGRPGVRLEGVPVALVRASQEHRAGLLRELTLMTFDDSALSTLSGRLVTLSEDLAAHVGPESVSMLAQVDDAEERGDLTFDLSMEVTAGVADTITAIVGLLEQADQRCAEGALLTLAASEEIRAFRRWCAVEITNQVGGGAPNRWRDR